MLWTTRVYDRALAGSEDDSAWPAVRQLFPCREKRYLITVKAPECSSELDAVGLGVTDFKMMREDEDLHVETTEWEPV
jgi:hypothetical protein